MSEELIGIRAMCEAFDVTPRALRFYEQKELLFPLRDGQKRLYNRRDRARLKLILRGKHYGIGLEEVRQLLDLYDMESGQDVQIHKVLETARRRLAEMIEQRNALDTLIKELSDHIALGEGLAAADDKARSAA